MKGVPGPPPADHRESGGKNELLFEEADGEPVSSEMVSFQ